MPFTIGTSGIDVDRNEDDIADTDFITYCIHPIASFRKRHIEYLRHQKRSIIAAIQQFCYDAGGDNAIVLIFEKFAVWAAFAGRFDAVTVIDEDFHGVALLILKQLTDSYAKIQKKSD